jgi:hypothetical protein
MPKLQYTMLFEEDHTSLRTLLSPINLAAFYEWYKKGDFVSIKKRFSHEPKSYNISDFEIEGVYRYVEMLVELTIRTGPGLEQDANFVHFTSFGTLWA